MKYDPSKPFDAAQGRHHRRSIRMKGYDYHNAGAYFVTICVDKRECLLDDAILNAIINDVWQALTMWFPNIELDEFVIMPNHIHFIVWILDGVGVGVSLADTHDGVGTPLAGVLDDDMGAKDGGKTRPYDIPRPEKFNPTPALGDIVGAFKSLVFKVYLDWVKKNDPSRRAKFWQANYYEHIIRNDRELNAIRQYIVDNPANWEKDRDNLENVRGLPPPAKVEDYLEEAWALMGWEKDK